MRSASRGSDLLRAAAVLACGAVLGGALGGCATTQDTARAKQAESKRILEAREQRRAAKKKHDEKKGGEQR